MDRKINVSKRSPIMLSAGVAVLVAVYGAAVFGVWSGGTRVKALRGEVAAAEAEVADLTKAREDFVSLKQSIERIESEQANVASLIPSRKQVLNNIELLEEMAQATNVSQTIDIFDLPPPDPKAKKTKQPVIKDSVSITLPAGFDAVDYALTVRGNFSDVASYIKLLERQPFLTTVRTVDIQAEKSDARGASSVNSGQVITKLEGRFYFAKEE